MCCVIGGDEQLSPGPDGKLISSEERMEQVRSGNPTETITTTEGIIDVCMYVCQSVSVCLCLSVAVVGIVAFQVFG